MATPKDTTNILPLTLLPGVDRDSTLLQSERWTDIKNARFFLGRPRKIGGWVASNEQVTGYIRGLHNYWTGGQGFLHSFSQSKIERMTLSVGGTLSAVTDRTPSGFTINSNNNWQFDVMFDAASANASLIAHCTENLSDPGSGTSRPVYIGDVASTSVLTTTGQSIDGGIIVVFPFLVIFGAAGEVKWSDSGLPNSFTGGDSGSARVTHQKIIRGLRYRGGGSLASALLWSLDSLILMRHVTGTTIFDFTTLTDQISVLSSNGIVEYEGKYYWPAMDRFMMYDGTVRTLPNNLNVNDFYDNINFTHRQKVWATIIPRFGEIWWHYPRGDNTECSHAICYNVHESRLVGQPVWYDNEIARTAGVAPKDFRFPLWSGATQPTAEIYQHENGTDDDGSAMESYVESNVITWAERNLNDWTLLKRVEPDFKKQTGDVTLTTRGREYAQGSDTDDTFTLATTDTKEDMTIQRRQLRLKFGSNVVGGDYEIGRPLLHVQRGTGQ